MSGVEPAHRGPAVEPVAHIRRDTLLTRETDEGWNETVVAVGGGSRTTDTRTPRAATAAAACPEEPFSADQNR
jgi:hypothetical protein